MAENLVDTYAMEALKSASALKTSTDQAMGDLVSGANKGVDSMQKDVIQPQLVKNVKDITAESFTNPDRTAMILREYKRRGIKLPPKEDKWVTEYDLADGNTPRKEELITFRKNSMMRDSDYEALLEKSKESVPIRTGTERDDRNYNPILDRKKGEIKSRTSLMVGKQLALAPTVENALSSLHDAAANSFDVSDEGAKSANLFYDNAVSTVENIIAKPNQIIDRSKQIIMNNMYPDTKESDLTPFQKAAFYIKMQDLRDPVKRADMLSDGIIGEALYSSGISVNKLSPQDVAKITLQRKNMTSSISRILSSGVIGPEVDKKISNGLDLVEKQNGAKNKNQIFSGEKEVSDMINKWAVDGQRVTSALNGSTDADKRERAAIAVLLHRLGYNENIQENGTVINMDGAMNDIRTAAAQGTKKAGLPAQVVGAGEGVVRSGLRTLGVGN